MIIMKYDTVWKDKRGTIMIKLIEMECGNCGGALEQLNKEKAKCPHCGAIYLIDKEEPKEIHVHQTVHQQSGWFIAIAFGIIVIALLFFLVVSICNSYTTSGNRTPSVVSEMHEEPFRSEFFKELVMEVYGTFVEEVTEEELKELTSLYAYTENGCCIVEYSRNNGEIKQIQKEG